MFSADELGKYGLVFGMLVAAGFGAPIPEEIPIATGGVMVGRAWVDPSTLPPGETQSGPYWYVMLPLCILGVVLCDTILYVAGRQWGRWLIRRHWVQRRLLSPERFLKIEKNFHDYGIRILLIARLLPGIRTPVFLSAGIVRLPFRKFLLADIIYAIPGVNLIFWLAYWLTDAFMNLLHRVESYRELAVVAILSFIAGFITATFVRRPVATGSPEELPVLGKPVVTIANPQVPEQKVGDILVIDGRAHAPCPEGMVGQFPDCEPAPGSNGAPAASANGQPKSSGPKGPAESGSGPAPVSM